MLVMKCDNKASIKFGMLHSNAYRKEKRVSNKIFLSASSSIITTSIHTIKLNH